MASTRVTPFVSACARRSVDVSTRMLAPGSSGRSIRIEGRVRRSWGSLDVQTAQAQPIIGTPCEVPVPRRVTLRFNNALSGARYLDEPHAQFVQHLLEHLALLGSQIAAGLLIEQRQYLDHLRGAI